jgi:uncharacterized membrane protein YphA (DoxX/SURF4 family)
MFVLAAWSKVAEPHAFAISVRAYKIIPVSLSNLFALVVPWTELITGVLLIAGLWTRKAAAAATLLLAMFAVAVSAVVVRGMAVDCGCFGSGGGSTTGPLMIVRNLALLAAALLVMRYNDGFLGLDGLRRSPARRVGDTI